jgi:hypothetical protein
VTPNGRRALGKLAIVVGLVGGVGMYGLGALSGLSGIGIGDCNSACSQRLEKSRSQGEWLQTGGAIGGIVLVVVGIALRPPKPVTEVKSSSDS